MVKYLMSRTFICGDTLKQNPPDMEKIDAWRSNFS
jgi:hypothetical protein